MDDQPPYRDPGDDARASSQGADRPPATPGWVKVFGIIALVVVLLFVVLMFTGGRHGPGRHLSSGDAAAQTPLSRVAQGRAPSQRVGCS